MATSQETRRNICAEVPSVLAAVRQTEGFIQQTPEVKEAIVDCASWSVEFSRDPNDKNREELQKAFANLQNVDGRPLMAFEAALRAHHNLEENLGHQW